MKTAFRIAIAAVMLAGIAVATIPAARDEVHWLWASGRDQSSNYASYLKSWPNGRHATAARGLYDEHAWADAQVANTYRAHQVYLDTHPQGRFVQEAKAQQTELLLDDTPFLAAQDKGTEEAFIAFLEDFPGHKRQAEAQSALKDLEGRDIVDLVAEKKIEVQSQGDGIERVSIKARRLVPYPVVLRIPVGTFFVSSSQSAQNMITTSESKFTLRSDGWEYLSPSVACANRPRDIPGSGDSFTVQRSPNQAELNALMPFIEKAKAGFAVRQAAVWIVTDNADYYDLGTLVSTSANTLIVFGGKREINEYETVRALEICDQAGIDITKRAIWRDKQKLVEGLKDERLKKWLEDKQ